MLELICDTLNGDYAAFLILGILVVGGLVILSRLPLVDEILRWW